MIIDFKYHIASIIAVFLALGIGILIGSAVLGNNVNEAIFQQQSRIYDNLRRDLDKMKSDNRAAKMQIKSWESSINVNNQFEKGILPVLVDGLLTGRTIAVVVTGDGGNLNELINTLKIAGAKISSTTTILDGFSLANESKRKEVATKLMLQGSAATMCKEISREVAEGIISRQNIENLMYFKQLGIVKISGSYGIPVDAVILAGGNTRSLCDNIDVPIIKYLLSKNVMVFGVESSQTQNSYMKQYQKLKISTIDNIDMVPGQLSLIMALSGKIGDYGIKPTAQRLIPEIP